MLFTVNLNTTPLEKSKKQFRLNPKAPTFTPSNHYNKENQHPNQIATKKTTSILRKAVTSPSTPPRRKTRKFYGTPSTIMSGSLKTSHRSALTAAVMNKLHLSNEDIIYHAILIKGFQPNSPTCQYTVNKPVTSLQSKTPQSQTLQPTRSAANTPLYVNTPSQKGSVPSTGLKHFAHEDPTTAAALRHLASHFEELGDRNTNPELKKKQIIITALGEIDIEGRDTYGKGQKQHLARIYSATNSIYKTYNKLQKELKKKKHLNHIGILDKLNRVKIILVILFLTIHPIEETKDLFIKNFSKSFSDNQQKKIEDLKNALRLKNKIKRFYDSCCEEANNRFNGKKLDFNLVKL